MFEISNQKTIKETESQYLAFPDLLVDKDNPNIIYMVYRQSDYHHPTKSKLHILISTDKGKSWDFTHGYVCPAINSNIEEHGKVFNCPRLSYFKNELVVICDTKTDRKEVDSDFKTYMYEVINLGMLILAWAMEDKGVRSTSPPPTIDDVKTDDVKTELPFTGMCPDKLIEHNGNTICANHIIKDKTQRLMQFYNVYDGTSWGYNRVLADHPDRDYCEASIVSNGEHLYCYMRDNSNLRSPERLSYNEAYMEHIRDMKPVYVARSIDGFKWEEPVRMPFYGHRVVAIHDKENNKIIGTYRNTKKPSVSIFSHDADCALKDVHKSFISTDIESDGWHNLYHMGYTGLVQIGNGKYLVAYYIKGERKNPCIRTCEVSL